METPRPPEVFAHPAFADTILPRLRPLLPYPLPLYRRLQFSFHSPHSRVLATFPPTDSNAELPPCFAIAYVDRSRRPETECWLFLGGEVPGVEKGHDETERRGPVSVPPCRACAKALYAVLEHIASIEVPPSAHSKDEGERRTAVAENGTVGEFEMGRRANMAHLEKPSVILLGAVSARVQQILNWALLAPKAYATDNFPYKKYLFRLDAIPRTYEALPENLCWGKVREQDWALIKSRTVIPRQDRTLRLLQSLAIFPEPCSGRPDPDPVAWAFLGLDASLSSLWVEPLYRGQGLAKKLSAKLLREGHAGVFDVCGEDGGGFAHTDTGSENGEANGVFKALGGQPAWTVYWIRADLDRVREPLSSQALEAVARLDADLPKRERTWEQSTV